MLARGNLMLKLGGKNRLGRQASQHYIITQAIRCIFKFLKNERKIHHIAKIIYRKLKSDTFATPLTQTWGYICFTAMPQMLKGVCM